MANALAQRLRRLEAIRQVAEQIAQPAAAWPRGVPARPAGADRRDQAAAMVGDALRSAVGLCGAAADPGAVFCARAKAHGVVACRGARGARAAGRPVVGLEPARPISHRISGRAVACGRRCSRRALRRRSNWCAKAASKCISTRPLRRFMCVSGRLNDGRRRAVQWPPNRGMGKRGEESMANVAEMRVIVGDKDDEQRSRSARRNCASSKRCCLPPRRRSTKRLWRRACRPASTCARCSRNCRTNMRRAA